MRAIAGTRRSPPWRSLDFVAREAVTRLAPQGTSCPDHFIRTKVRPLLLDLPPTAPPGELVARLRELHAGYRDDYAAYYQRYATVDSPPMRGADPVIVLVPGVGMFSFGPDARAARIAGEFYVNAINVMRGAEAVSTYAPIDEAEKFRIEYWELEEAKLRRLPPPRPLAGRVAFVTGAASGIGRAIAARLGAEGAAVVLADRDAAGARGAAADRGGADVAVAVEVDVGDEGAVRDAIREASATYGGVDLVVNNAGLSISKPLVDTTTDDWDRQHRVMARGSFLVSREAARVMGAQGLTADIVYVVSKNAVVAGKDNVAYGAPRPTRRTRCAWSPPSSARTACGSTGSIPTGSCAARASSRRAGARSAPGCTACPPRSWASSTPGAWCSAMRCCPSTWPGPSSPCAPATSPSRRGRSCRSTAGCRWRSSAEGRLPDDERG